MTESSIDNKLDDVSDPRRIDFIARRDAWRRSPERRQWVKQVVWLTLALGIGGFAVGLLLGLFYDSPTDGSTTQEFVTLTTGLGFSLGVSGAAYAGFYMFAFRRRAFNDRLILAEARGELRQAEDDLALEGQDTSFSALWVATQRRLDYYHEIATSQSQRSFVYGQAAAAAGLLIVLVCTVFAIATTSTAGAIAAGVLGGSGAAMSGYIGSTFLRTQDISAQQLRAYFSQPLEFSRFLSAERLLQEIGDPVRREEATVMLIQAMAASADPTSLGEMGR